MYYFIRCADYSDAMPTQSLYESFDHLAKNTYDPDIRIAPAGQIPILPKTCFASPAQRTLSTASQLGLQPAVLSELAEIRFSMKQIMSESDFKALESENQVRVARQAFYAKLVTDKLDESFEDVVRRIRMLLHQLLASKEPVLCVGHSFFLKTVEVVALHPSALEDPASFLDYYDGSQKAYEFLTGYELSRGTLANLANEIDTKYSIIGGNHE